MFYALCFMLIGIDASRAFIKNRTGIEEYSYQVIRNLVPLLKDDQVVLYVRKNQKSKIKNQNVNVKIKIIKFPFLWTQLGLSLEMLFHPVDVLFIPAHTVPIIHSKNTIVTIHGLEYEFFPRAYSFWERLYMRWSIRNSCRWAKKIIAVSNNTKKDLMRLYKVPEEKIEVIYEGYEDCHSGLDPESSLKNLDATLDSRFHGNDKYLLFIGRLEERKNIVGIIRAFEILKKQHKIPHKLILAGKFGYGEDKIKNYISKSSYKSEIITPGYISEEEKWELLKNSDVFLFPTFYEGFGLPILEAQSAGVPVVAGNNSSILEITTVSASPQMRGGNEGGELKKTYDQPLTLNPSPHLGRGGVESTLLVNPHNPEKIAEAAYKLISNKALRDDIIQRGYENVKRFGWGKCADQIAKLLTK
ncbi:MAG: glycosyltransferase family 1 protein [Candidatus Moranbacteria bacterium]|nr:glycosyltransferase family 1 protein [Candidatus Moranbacteria bacterium]